MRKLILLNRVTNGVIWVDARLSNGDIPFDNLDNVSGFPRKLQKKETVEIHMLDFEELLFRRSFCDSDVYMADLYRIGFPTDRDEVLGNIWPSIADPKTIESENNAK
ncbi:hypothetical protein KBF38_03810 [bacterium]|nr:hypothetical protein [bacterium]